ncbi:hypothetical protein L3Q82_004275 [Scortum barcoo]|uniref:Uncharacterized protein n=1 Tax=Scortum barcoo TaxID=214431 RepID=A0ACB8VJ31_9TELE|nr:hypothetical protein L3Q82_004275 [Scortum barcoo]
MFDSTCYFFSTTSASWEQSRRDCRDKGADLVVIESYEEQTFVAASVSFLGYVITANQVQMDPSKELLTKIIKKETWIGLNDREKEGDLEVGSMKTPLTQAMSFAEEAELEDPGEATPISMAEVVKKLLSGKAPDVDEICLEMLKVLDTVGLLWQTRFFRVI